MLSRLSKIALPVGLAFGLMAVALPAYATNFSTCSGPGNQGATCVWVNVQSDNNGGEQGDFFGSNSNFANVVRDYIYNWNDVASSAFNDGNGSYNAALYSNSLYSGTDLCLKVGYGNANFVNINWNDVASSNDWYTVGSSYNCTHTD